MRHSHSITHARCAGATIPCALLREHQEPFSKDSMEGDMVWSPQLLGASCCGIHAWRSPSALGSAPQHDPCLHRIECLYVLQSKLCRRSVTPGCRIEATFSPCPTICVCVEALTVEPAWLLGTHWAWCDSSSPEGGAVICFRENRVLEGTSDSPHPPSAHL